ncbi:hypothetical protein [Geobacter sp. SVR]|uniref:hypothetical protein n=1 Tax=Geobacter sp. SVR TaxID=2495594 RepID=UPI00143EFC17|nr:hypothetical protein [Geobacter sp. SVR]BCS55714.1 lipoprotein [Geobacter sp. SVR]GCF83718.1 lipoprotein [Geobacter sp. SVR]
MKKLLFLLPFLLLAFGCARNHLNVPADSFTEKVKVLGVVPIIVDTGSDIRHPQKDQLISLVTEMNRRYEQQFVRRLKTTGNFYTVALMDGNAQEIFSNLLFRREKRDDAAIQYNKYFWKNEELRNYLRKNSLDAVMIIIISGLAKNDKIYSNTLMSSLTGEYNYLVMTAQILDGAGTILWEYPNFRGHILSYEPMIGLQYPDFSEAEANLSTKAEIKFKTLDGLRRKLEERRKDYLLRETNETTVYGKQFDEMLSFLHFDPEKEQKESARALPTPPAERPKVESQTPVAPAAVEKPLAPVSAVPVVAPAVAPAAPLPGKTQGFETIKPSSEEIVPASGKVY